MPAMYYTFDVCELVGCFFYRCALFLCEYSVLRQKSICSVFTTSLSLSPFSSWLLLLRILLQPYSVTTIQTPQKARIKSRLAAKSLFLCKLRLQRKWAVAPYPSADPSLCLSGWLGLSNNSNSFFTFLGQKDDTRSGNGIQKSFWSGRMEPGYLDTGQRSDRVAWSCRELAFRAQAGARASSHRWRMPASCQWMPQYLSYFSIALTKHHDQGNLAHKESFSFGACDSRGLEFMAINMAESTGAGVALDQ